MAERSWLELSDDDEKVDSEEARKIIEARLKKRKEEAEKMSAPSSAGQRGGGGGHHSHPLQRSATVHTSSGCSYLPGIDSRNNRRGGGGRSSYQQQRRGFVSCYGLLDSPCSPSRPASPGLPSSCAGTSPLSQPTSSSLVRPTVPTYTVDGDDVVFSEVYDIWFTDPSVISTRGTSKDMYDHACCYVGSFQKISEFYAFHNAIDWDNIPDGSVVAYCKKDIKPQWEAPANAQGGRFMFKHFPRPSTERVFTKIALGFLSGLLTDWHNYNLVSLHIRSSTRGSDIQLWRRIANSTGMTPTLVLNDIKALIFEDAHGSSGGGRVGGASGSGGSASGGSGSGGSGGNGSGSGGSGGGSGRSGGSEFGLGSNGTINWMPNSGSVQRNDHRINHFRQKQHGSGLMSTQSLDSGIRLMEEDVQDLWASSASSRGGLTEEMRKAMVAAADAELSSVTPTGLGLRSADDCLTNFHNTPSTTNTLKRNKMNSLASVLSRENNSAGSNTTTTTTNTTTTTDSPTSSSPTSSSPTSSSPTSSSPTTTSSSTRYSREFVKATPTLRRTQQHCVPTTPTKVTPRKFCFTQVAELLPSSTDASQSCSEAGTESDSSKKPLSKITLDQNRPYPAYDAPLSMQAWHRGKALKEHAVD